MRYFFDTEYIADGKTITLISLGMVAADGRELYAVSTEFDERKASDWVKRYVLPQLPPRPHPAWQDLPSIRDRVRAFIGHTHPEFWAYFAAYDWILLCQLWGTMFDIPDDWPMMAWDLRQWSYHLGNPPLPPQEKGEHDALEDARWNRQVWDYLYLLSQRSERAAPR